MPLLPVPIHFPGPASQYSRMLKEKLSISCLSKALQILIEELMFSGAMFIIGWRHDISSPVVVRINLQMPRASSVLVT